MKKTYKKRIAPKLISGESRVPRGLNLPPAVNDGLREIGRRERQSVSWVLEKVILEYFGLRRLQCTRWDVEYKTPKTPAPEPKSKLKLVG